MRVALIGGGVMGEAVLGAALDADIFEAEQAIVCEVVPERRAALSERYGVKATGSAQEAMAGADVVVLSVKPQDAGSVKGGLAPEALLLSVMAGVQLRTLEAMFRHQRIVRVMPNTPAAVRAGMSVWTATAAVDASQREATRRLLGALGREMYVESEAKVDMATAVSGSGPAYVFLVIEAMIDAGVAIGLTRAQATEMTLQTVQGSALYAQQSEFAPAELRARVTSPAGTTAAGLLEMERGALRATIIDGVRAAYERAVELGEEA